MADNKNEQKILEQLKDRTLRNSAFSFVVEKYSPKIYWHIRNMVLSHDDANDLVQETFIKAWNSLDTFRGEAHISTWLYRIAINETLAFLKKRQIETVPIDSDEYDIAGTIESDAYFCGDSTDILFRRAINTLPEKQRLVFNMKYFEEMKYEEMSDILGTSIGALKASYHIAVKKIEKFIEENN
ncbi:MAG: RNA polymerase sigma factor [Bacteroidaceae bacterium]|nr:RNA polymerase sigma factor [Bacteroidaceae bacterium]